MKRTGKCPKCQSENIRRQIHYNSMRRSTGVGSYRVADYLCQDCGYIERYHTSGAKDSLAGVANMILFMAIFGMVAFAIMNAYSRI